MKMLVARSSLISLLISTGSTIGRSSCYRPLTVQVTFEIHYYQLNHDDLILWQSGEAKRR